MEKWKRNKNVKYASVASTAKVWEVSERSVRNYCAQGRVPGSLISGKTWLVPKDAKKPERLVRHTLASKKQTVLDILQREKDARLPGGMYHRVQIELTYNSNHIEGSRLSHDQTRYIFETHTIGVTDKEINVDDIVETANHFRCVDIVIDGAKSKLTESFIKQLHFVLKNGTSDSRKSWFKIGDYKILENEVGGISTAKPSEVKAKIKQLLLEYNEKKTLDFDDILDFHVRFERIHPFQDGNGRIGRLILFKECLKHNITPFIITEKLKHYYYRGINEWYSERGFLRDTCLTAQDEFIKRFGVRENYKIENLR